MQISEIPSAAESKRKFMLKRDMGKWKSKLRHARGFSGFQTNSAIIKRTDLQCHAIIRADFPTLQNSCSTLLPCSCYHLAFVSYPQLSKHSTAITFPESLHQSCNSSCIMTSQFQRGVMYTKEEASLEQWVKQTHNRQPFLKMVNSSVVWVSVVNELS